MDHNELCRLEVFDFAESVYKRTNERKRQVECIGLGGRLQSSVAGGFCFLALSF